MAKRITYNIITGNDTRLRMCFYYSPYFDMNIWRRGSTLTGKRTKKDPAFKGFRQSSNRLKQASPIAASLYKQVPVLVKQYALYRTLTGEAIKMLKEGTEVAVITETLQEKYINPLLNAPEKKSEFKTVKEPVTRGRERDMADFNAYPQIPSGVRKITRTRRSGLLQIIREGQSGGEYFSSANCDTLAQASKKDISAFTLDEPQRPAEPKPRTKTTHGLIYLGRLPECKKLKMWLRPVDATSYS